jgi:multidrug efflux pump subunit AcrA (membrane-fusion protein)
LERRLATARSQKDQAVIRAPFNGLIDRVDARVGEQAMPGIPLVGITSPEGMYVQADVSERFIGTFQVGDEVDLQFPVQDSTIQSTITAVSQVINADNRTFSIEAKLPWTKLTVKPNQTVVVHLNDYTNPKAYTISTRLIQVDEKGEYIFQIVEENDKHIAKKLYVKSGMTYQGKTEITEGLDGNEILADKGFRELTDRAVVTVYKENDQSVAKN